MQLTTKTCYDIESRKVNHIHIHTYAALVLLGSLSKLETELYFEIQFELIKKIRRF